MNSMDENSVVNILTICLSIMIFLLMILIIVYIILKVKQRTDVKQSQSNNNNNVARKDNNKIKKLDGITIEIAKIMLEIKGKNKCWGGISTVSKYIKTPNTNIYSNKNNKSRKQY